VGKPWVQKTLLICLINIHNFRNSDCVLVDRSSKNLTTLCLFIKYFGRSCLLLAFNEEHSKHSGIHRRISDNYINYSRFRTTNHYLPFETGRWRNIDRENRYCNLCNCQKLGDEYHYVLECSSLNDKRKQLLPKYFMKRHNVVKFFELLSTKKQSLLRKLCIFIKHINKVFCTPGLPTVVP
jgi:hypothetical protein